MQVPTYRFSLSIIGAIQMHSWLYKSINCFIINHNLSFVAVIQKTLYHALSSSDVSDIKGTFIPYVCRASCMHDMLNSSWSVFNTRFESWYASWINDQLVLPIGYLFQTSGLIQSFRDFRYWSKYLCGWLTFVLNSNIRSSNNSEKFL